MRTSTVSVTATRVMQKSDRAVSASARRTARGSGPSPVGLIVDALLVAAPMAALVFAPISTPPASRWSSALVRRRDRRAADRRGARHRGARRDAARRPRAHRRSTHSARRSPLRRRRRARTRAAPGSTPRAWHRHPRLGSTASCVVADHRSGRPDAVLAGVDRRPRTGRRIDGSRRPERAERRSRRRTPGRSVRAWSRGRAASGASRGSSSTQVNSSSCGGQHDDVELEVGEVRAGQFEARRGCRRPRHRPTPDILSGTRSLRASIDSLSSSVFRGAS